MTQTKHTKRIGFFAALAASVALLGAAAAPAFAAPAIRVDSLATTTAAPGSTLRYIVQVSDVGDAPLDGTSSPITFTATLPAGLTASSAAGAQIFDGWDCSTLVVGASSFTCTNSVGVFPISQSTSLLVNVAVDNAASGVLTSRFDVAGGGAPTGAGTVDPTTITPDAPGFGIDAFDGSVTSDAAGTPFTQAGGHPYAISTSIDFNTIVNGEPLKGTPWPVEAVKDVVVELPPGLVGNPAGIAECTGPQLANSERISPRPLCPPSSQVGVTLVRANFNDSGSTVGPLPVFNMVPPPDAPARFGFNVFGTVVTFNAHVRSGSDYGVGVDVSNIPEGLDTSGTTVTLWGVPADPVHEPERACAGQEAPSSGGPTCSSGAPLSAFLRNPTSCTDTGVGLPTVLRTDSWVDPGDFDEATFFSHVPNGHPYPPSDWGAQQGPDGCARVPFNPRFEGEPVSPLAGEPAAFAFDLSLPQSDTPGSIGQSDLRKAVVTLPQGVRVNSASAAGLGGCSSSEIALRSESSPSCPDSSKIGTVEIDTPLLEDPLAGSIYLAKPFDNPSNSLVAIYLVAEGAGVTVKLAGKTEMDPATGQITATFDDNPQVPFSNVHLEFKGGPRAPPHPARVLRHPHHPLGDDGLERQNGHLRQRLHRQPGLRRRRLRPDPQRRRRESPGRRAEPLHAAGEAHRRRSAARLPRRLHPPGPDRGAEGRRLLPRGRA